MVQHYMDYVTFAKIHILCWMTYIAPVQLPQNSPLLNYEPMFNFELLV